MYDRDALVLVIRYCADFTATLGLPEDEFFADSFTLAAAAELTLYRKPSSTTISSRSGLRTRYQRTVRTLC
jgi:hypothetical protein